MVASVHQAYRKRSRHAMDIDAKKGYAEMGPVRDTINLLKRLGYERYVPKGAEVADFCCGQGADLGKFGHMRVKSYIGIDFVSAALDVARHRARTNPKLQSVAKEIEFLEVDLTKNVVRIDPPVDVVVLQLALHYLWLSPEAIKTVFESISSSLKPGGVFLCTVIDSEAIPTEGITEHQHEHVRLEWLPNGPNGANESKEGTKTTYRFTFPGLATGLEERVVPKDELIKVAQQHGLKLLDSFGCKEKWAEIDALPTPKAKVPLTDADWRILKLYRCFAFSRA